MIFKLASSTLLMIGVFAISLQLLFDPWMQERFERVIRENCRLNTKLLDLDVPDRMDQIREVFGVLGILTTFGSFMKYLIIRHY